MDNETYRRFSGGVGIVTIGIAMAFVFVAGVDVLSNPQASVLIGALVLAGALDVVAAVESPITERIAWYRLVGVAHIILGVVISLWFAGAVGTGLVDLAIFAFVLFSTAGVGIDMLFFDGRHFYQEPLEA